jgi:hypothetical protein
MKLVTFDAGRVGRLEGEIVVELACGSTREWFERGGQVGESGERLALADVRLRAPIVPKKFFHTAGNFADHHAELQAVDWSHPVHKGIVFFQNVDAIIGPDDAIVYPEGLTRELDYELELAIIIGRSGKFFGPEEAGDYIAGYTVFNDITARDIQRREMRSGDRDQGRTAGRHRAGDGAAGQRPGAAAGQHRAAAHPHPAPRRLPLGPGILGRGHPHHGDHLRGSGGAARPVRVLPAARGQDRGRDRGRRRAAQPRGPLERRP